ncbi:hypothetical protein BCR36DRAFT_582203 [Piromyces finnis]|uniref:Uncharacterized protein n=1 Tax=Piromyces finnis TaxID=1754191 RepID=A0A1Y1VDE7_9FUNG|nr:hypothetical protein BCR36DRAFT_582203 [Piromyces finnis]|eukprot:ORX53351.1 hypothetical protein BCR36DRAFT_582203 [Piromyces finnis]
MNVDLNWCPCGKQFHGEGMYCSNACYLKDLTSNNLKKDFFYSDNIYQKNFSKYMNITTTAAYVKVPDVKNMILSASNNLAFKNRKKHQSNYYYNGNYNHSHGHSYNVQNYTSNLASSYESNTSTIDDYFKKQTFTKVEDIPKQNETLLKSKIDENVKEKTETKSYNSRSSYKIEAVYPVQNFTRNTIAVY